MGKYMITYRCGHNEERQLSGKYKERDEYIEYAKHNRVCSECYDQQLAQDNAAAGLPPLTGSPGQIAWTEKIRSAVNKHLVEIEQAMVRPAAAPGLSERARQEMQDAAVLLVDEIRDQTDASWWIDHRHKFDTGSSLSQHLVDQIRARGLAPTAVAEEAALNAAAKRAREEEALREATAQASTFHVNEHPDSIVLAGTEVYIWSSDGRSALGNVNGADWTVYQVDLNTFPSTHPEMERIAREARAVWEQNQAVRRGAAPSRSTHPLPCECEDES